MDGRCICIQHCADDECFGSFCSQGRSAGFGTEVSTLLQALPGECRCIVLARGAVMGSEPLLRDLTPDVRRRLGL